MSLEHFRHLLERRRTIVETGHKNLVPALSRLRLVNAKMTQAVFYIPAAID